MLKRWTASSEKRMSIGTSSPGSRSSCPSPGAATKKSSSVDSPRGVHDHEAAGARPGERRLGDERHQHRRDRRVDRVAAGAQDIRPGLGRERMAGCDHPSHRREPRR